MLHVYKIFEPGLYIHYVLITTRTHGQVPVKQLARNAVSFRTTARPAAMCDSHCNLSRNADVEVARRVAREFA